MEKSIGIIILAAGGSRRLGQPKQLLKYEATTLLRHVVSEAILAEIDNVTVVTGAKQEAIKAELQSFEITTVHNPLWEQGMGKSIAVGVGDLLLRKPKLSGCILAVCDQPFVSTAVFNSLIKKFDGKSQTIIASAYAGTVGTPVLFGSHYFPELLKLQESDGAKTLLNKFKNDVHTIPFDKGQIDIDTMADYELLLSQL